MLRCTVGGRSGAAPGHEPPPGLQQKNHQRNFAPRADAPCSQVPGSERVRFARRDAHCLELIHYRLRYLLVLGVGLPLRCGGRGAVALHLEGATGATGATAELPLLPRPAISSLIRLSGTPWARRTSSIGPFSFTGMPQPSGCHDVCASDQCSTCRTSSAWQVPRKLGRS